MIKKDVLSKTWKKSEKTWKKFRKPGKKFPKIFWPPCQNHLKYVNAKYVNELSNEMHIIKNQIKRIKTLVLDKVEQK